MKRRIAFITMVLVCGMLQAQHVANTGTQNTGVLSHMGSFGIGTTSIFSGAKLDVRGSVYMPNGNSYWIGATGDAGARVRIHNSGTDAYFDYYNTLYFRSGASSSTKFMTLTSDGKLGIGVGLTPSYPLHVAGIIYSSTGGFRFPDGTVQTTAATSSNPWTINGSNIYRGTGNVGIGLSNPSKQLHVGSTTGNGVFRLDALSTSYSYQNTWDIENDFSNSALNFKYGGATNSSGVLDNSITTSTKFSFKFTGRLGMGVTEPNNSLHIYGNPANNIPCGIELENPSSVWNINDDSYGNFSINTPNLSSGLYINKTSGNVGIGCTTTADQKLTVSGYVKAQGYLLPDGTPITSGGGNLWLTGTNNYVYCIDQSQSRSQRVGINTSNPSSTLHVLSATEQPSLGLEFFMPMGGNNAQYSWGIKNVMEELAISYGYELISNGVPNPNLNKVDVFRFNYGGFFNIIGDPANSNIGGINFPGSYLMSSTSSGNLSITYNSSSLFTINKSTGNIGIGTATPNCKLAVAGKIRATQVEILSNVNADYVFKKDYKLRSLSEVETYIKNNEHLPDVPSAKEMEGKPQNLSEFDNLLLQKVEELTLYTIQQQKQIDQQKELIESLIKKMDQLNK